MADPASEKITFQAFAANQKIRAGLRSIMAFFMMPPFLFLAESPINRLNSFIFMAALCFLLVVCRMLKLISISSQSVHSGLRAVGVIIAILAVPHVLDGQISALFMLFLYVFLFVFGLVKFMQGLMEVL